ncbi:E2F-associated phosphoprotein (EAPP) [Durusdinium trenchii]|uniref:E2F-associated phosphoprotein (EAPP) n=1 Tax=Durusdinium trenchii TaxID=1381693 RepID=A0ABP0QBE7_9DINO
MAASMEVDDDEEDDWNPVVKPGVVLRPHVLQWNGTGPKEGQGDRDVLEADPLHDPEADDEDQKWVEDQLLQPDQSNVRSTDAVLNCPGCFTPVCYQCQRHERYSNQWRASDVRNCTVDRSIALSMAKDRTEDDPSKYYAVRCETCKADVGLLDMDGIFHLFHVLESLA